MFGVQPASIGYVGEQYKVTQGDAMDASRRVGLGRLLAVRKEFYDDLCRRLGCPDVEDDPDREEQVARTAVLSCGGPFKTVDEVRAERGLGPLPEGERPHGGDDTPPDDGDEPVERWDPNQPRDACGRWAGSNAQVKRLKKGVRRAVASHAMHGGSTFDIRGKDLVGMDAWAVALRGTTWIVESETVTADTLHDFVGAHEALLANKGHAIGTWYNPDERSTYVDVVRLIKEEHSATRMARKHNQIAIFHLGRFVTKDIGGSGK